MTILCEEENQAKYYCQNSSCQQTYPFLCKSKRCLCYDQHRLCSKRDINETLRKIQAKMADTRQINKLTYMIHQKMVQALNKLLQTVTTKISGQIKYSNLTAVQRHFLKVINKQHEPTYVSGEQMSQLYIDACKSQKYAEEGFKLITEQLKRMSYDTQTHISYIESIVDQLSQKTKLNQILPLKTNFVDRCVSEKFPMIKRETVTQKIAKRFFDIQPQHIKLIFRASEFGFNMKQFYDNCQKTQNLLIVCLPKSGKNIVGGFSSKCFQSTNNLDYLRNQWIKDPTNRSFLFTFSDLQSECRKFKIKPGKYLMNRSTKRNMISFGLDEFVLVNKANSNERCTFQISGLNFNPPKQFKNLKSLQNFSVLEWQAWKVQLKNKNEQTSYNVQNITNQQLYLSEQKDKARPELQKIEQQYIEPHMQSESEEHQIIMAEDKQEYFPEQKQSSSDRDTKND